jgi:hypothetical protein
MIIQWDTIDGSDNYMDIDRLVGFKKPPSWYSKLTPYWNGSKNFNDFIKTQWSTIFQYQNYRMHTVKSCPGFNTFFKKSIQLKLDNDLLVETGADGGFVYTYLGNHFSLSSHNGQEAPGLSNKYIFLKFTYNLAFKYSKDCDVTFIDPVLYDEQPYRMCPGIIQTQKQNIMYVNVITLFPKVNTKYHFPKGSTLACMQFSEPVKDMKKVDLSEDIKKHNYEGQIRGNNSKYFGK